MQKRKEAIMNKHAMANEYKILCPEANKMVKVINGNHVLIKD